MRHIVIPLLILAVVMTIVSSAAGQWDNRNAATWYRKVAEMFGWEVHLGHLCGGGTMANFEALWVARQLHPGQAIAESSQAH